MIELRKLQTRFIPGLEFEVMDASRLQFDDESFECVVEKVVHSHDISFFFVPEYHVDQ